MKFNSPHFIDLNRMGLIPIHVPNGENDPKFDEFYAFPHNNTIYAIDLGSAEDIYDVADIVACLDDVTSIDYKMYSIIKKFGIPDVFLHVMRVDGERINVVFKTTTRELAILDMGYIDDEEEFDVDDLTLHVYSDFWHELICEYPNLKYIDGIKVKGM